MEESTLTDKKPRQNGQNVKTGRTERTKKVIQIQSRHLFEQIYANSMTAVSEKISRF